MTQRIILWPLGCFFSIFPRIFYHVGQTRKERKKKICECVSRDISFSRTDCSTIPHHRHTFKNSYLTMCLGMHTDREYKNLENIHETMIKTAFWATVLHITRTPIIIVKSTTHTGQHSFYQLKIAQLLFSLFIYFKARHLPTTKTQLLTAPALHNACIYDCGSYHYVQLRSSAFLTVSCWSFRVHMHYS